MSAPRRVLVVEDDDAIRDLLVEVLAQEGYAASGAPNGDLALAQLASEPLPDALVVDLRMVMGGVELLQRMRGDPRLARIRVLVVSATAHDPRLDALGVAAFLPKPIELRELLTLLAQEG